MEANHNKQTIHISTLIPSVDLTDRIHQLQRKTDQDSVEDPMTANVRIRTSGGLNILAHSTVMASVSTVLEKIIDRPRKRKTNEKVIPILGVPCDAVVSFVQFLYSSRCTEEDMDRYGIHLLALSHVFSVSQLKQRCTKGLSVRLMVDNVVDVLQLARLCDAPDLYLNCMKLVSKDFNSVEKTEGWKFLQENDAWLELEILQFIDDIESRKKKMNKNREAQSLYLQLSEAMECLEHICTVGCTNVGPYDKEPTKKRGPCKTYSTCQGLQILIKHFATCKKRVNGGCCRCKRMWQLLRLHSSICDQNDHCKVPLCRQFKLKSQLEKKGDDGRWRLLVKKVVSAKTISSLSSIKRSKREEQETKLSDGHGCCWDKNLQTKGGC